ncbi:hypothetical protein KLA_13976 [Cellulophaga geojensis KL-A]|uniref:Porin n=1 Tax=Cellulophaga geojensis KL-A TaxID=1328323 RepID=A0ABN0RLG7_9FLAO|nr:putative porin [Cellulophaga geojensis]EWH12615.1 hypothetical protein KLA_13976 [Cellulophaga geojensis KL-A]
MRYIVFVFLLWGSVAFAQNPISTKKDLGSKGEEKPGKVLAKGEEEKPSVEEYKIFTIKKDTTFLDTTLTIQKEYKYNYLRRDGFELMPFANIGKPSNRLGVDFDSESMYPSLSTSALTDNYWSVNQIKYYNVPTPLTELMFKTTMAQGQLLDAMLTFNMSPQLNISLGYKGFRSLGKYNYDQAESGNFTVTSNYTSKNNRYQLLAHIAAQDVTYQENGGLTDGDTQFETGDDEFTTRDRLDVAFIDAESIVLGKRYFLDQQYKLIKKDEDSTSSIIATSIAVGHQFSYETKFSKFNQDNQYDYFGDTFLDETNDKAHLQTTYNQLNTTFSNKLLGELKGFVGIYNYNYFFKSLLITPTGTIDNQLRGTEISLGAAYSKKIGEFNLKGEAAYNVSGDLGGSFLNAEATYIYKDKHKFKASLHNESKMPNFNFLLYQSNYQNYNWQNTASFDKQNINSLNFQYSSKPYGTLSAKYTNIDNYTYFKSTATEEQINNGQENAYIKPFQESASVGYLKVKYSKEFKFGRWALDNTVMYQNVSQSNSVLNLPEFVTRNTLYFSKDVFKKAMFIQTGVTFKYFTAYNMNAYNPALGEFYVQNQQKLGAYPMLDFFINGKVKQTRIYLKAEHFNSSFTGYDFYSAPNYPYRDFVIRFGLVWNFFS